MLNVLLLAACLLAPSQEPQPADPARELEFRYLLLADQYAQSEAEWNRQLKLYAAFPEQRNELLAKHPAKPYRERFEVLAGSGQPMAMLWLVEYADKLFDDRKEVAMRKYAQLRKLVDEHASGSSGMEIVKAISRQRHWIETKGVGDLLDDFAKKTQNREYAAGALVSLVSLLSATSMTDDARKRMNQATEQIVREYSDTESGRQFTEQLAIQEAARLTGQFAQSFVGKDVDGAELNLKALRGKVVLLEFWGFWNPRSRSLIPQLRELLERHAADPLVVLGVSSDEDPARFRELSKQHNVTWPSVWEGGRSGPIARTYNVRVYPTLYLIDSQGEIRRSWVGTQVEKSFAVDIEPALAALKAGSK